MNIVSSLSRQDTTIGRSPEFSTDRSNFALRMATLPMSTVVGTHTFTPANTLQIFQFHLLHFPDYSVSWSLDTNGNLISWN